MARIKIEEPAKYLYTFECEVRITDLNYGNHLANDKALVFAHEARLAWLSSMGKSELDFFGVSLIQGDAAIIYKSEGFYQNKIEIQIGVMDIRSSAFDLVYSMFNRTTNKPLLIAKTGMVCFDYSTRKVQAVPEQFKLETA